MENKIIEPVRWQDWPARITISTGNGDNRAYFQATAPGRVSDICAGRPVEELPRIVSILSPAHHIVSAYALDRLFGVETTPMGGTIREALLQTQFIVGHLRKLYFLASSSSNPFESCPPRHRQSSAVSVRQLSDETMRHVALAQEAASILGGRSDYPLTAVAGGTSRFLKEEHHRRLKEISGELLSYAEKSSKTFEKVLARVSTGFSRIGFGPMSGLSMKGEDRCSPDNPEEGEIVVADRSGKESDRFSVHETMEKVAFRKEPWSYTPFVYLKEKGWKDLFADDTSGLCFVGPLARLGSGDPLSTPLAEEARRRMIETLGAFPHFGVPAAFWALLVETVQAAEKMSELCVEERMVGPQQRNIPGKIGGEGFAALESPQGLIYHRYKVDSDGLVEKVEILDPAAENNAVRNLVANSAVKASTAGNATGWEETKKLIEASLLPF